MSNTTATASASKPPISRGGESKKSASANFGASANPPVTPRRREVQPKIFQRLPSLTTASAAAAAPECAVAAPPVADRIGDEASTTEPDFEVREVARQTSSEPLPETRRAGLARFKLGTPQDLRTAIVLREIFGPPRSWQPLDPIT
jgi:hypothetical protein